MVEILPRKEISLYGPNWNKKVFSYKCEIQMGTQKCPKHHNHLEFIGECYECDDPGHFHNHCPMKKCTRCRTYGHGEKVCPHSNIESQISIIDSHSYVPHLHIHAHPLLDKNDCDSDGFVKVTNKRKKKDINSVFNKIYSSRYAPKKQKRVHG